MMITIFIDNHKVKANKNQTILDAAKAAHIFIPTLCHLPGYVSRSVCRICLVEIMGQGHLAPACSTIVKEGMHVSTTSEKVVKTRQLIMELILAEHGSCQRPDCEIERLAIHLGVHATRFSLIKNKDSRALSSEYLHIQPELCIHCDRCIRACRDKKVISRAKRGAWVTMTVGPDQRLDETPCVHCRDCATVCPSGTILALPTNIPRLTHYSI